MSSAPELVEQQRRSACRRDDMAHLALTRASIPHGQPSAHEVVESGRRRAAGKPLGRDPLAGCEAAEEGDV
jgi:hypothetical protein